MRLKSEKLEKVVPRRWPAGVRQFAKFGVVGVSSTIIDWGIYISLTRFALVFYLIAKMISFIVSVTNSYIWHRRWTFRSKDPRRVHQFTKFLVVASVGLGLNTLIMYLVVSKIKLHDIIGLVLATSIVLFWNFLANKYFTFKE